MKTLLQGKEYTPSSETDISKTFSAFGFNPPSLTDAKMTDEAAAEYSAWVDKCYQESGDAEAFDNDVKRLVALCNKLTQGGFILGDNNHEALVNAADAVEAWFDETDDPRANGWVDDKGRP